MEVIALKTCSWTCKKKTYELEKGKKYKFPSTLKDYILATPNLFEVVSDKE
jgi:hypothetical protein